MSGKGSRPRPFSVSDEEYANRWDAIFGRDKPKDEPKHEICEECETVSHCMKNGCIPKQEKKK